MKYRLKVQESELSGELGLSIVSKGGRDWFDPAEQPHVLIHDMLEHPLKENDNPYADELMAIGAMYLVRYEGGYFPPRESGRSYRRSIEERDFVADVESVLRDGSDELEISPCRVADTDVSDFFARVAQEAVELWLKEEEYQGETVEYDPKLPEYVRSWLCKGYSAAKQRYSRFYPDELACKFSEFERQIAPMFKHIEFNGQTFEVSLVIESGNLTWKETTEYGE